VVIDALIVTRILVQFIGQTVVLGTLLILAVIADQLRLRLIASIRD
jgi:hypothetical protein